MAKSREIKRRMQSITNTRQITSAMKMVSASKLRRAQALVGSSRPYRDKLKKVLANVADSLGANANDPLLEVRPISKEGFVVFAANKGLAGGYNQTVLNTALRAIQEAQLNGHEVGVIAVGRKAADFFKKREIPVDEAYLDVADIPILSDSMAIAKAVQTAYITHQYDAVTMVYQEFRSAMSQKPIVVPILPIITDQVTADAEHGEDYHVDYIFEPNAEEILSELLPLYLSNQLHAALSDAKAGEHGARMTAMTAATDNATELLNALEVSYNRARQAAITNEITEIVAGADALG